MQRRVTETTARFILALIALACSSTGPLAVAQEPPIPLFTVLSGPPTEALSNAVTPAQDAKKPWVRSRRSIRLAQTALERLRQADKEAAVEFTLDLPRLGIVTTTVRSRGFSKRNSQVQVWHGSLKHMADSDMTLVVRGSDVAASIRKGQTIYEIRPSTIGPQLIEIDADRLPSDHHPIPVSREEMTSSDASTSPAAPGSTPAVASDNGSTIDVMVLYTTAAKDANGGQNGIEALINLGISLANQAFTNSQINTQFNLVHTAEVSYQESGSYNTDLSRLRNTSDGFMDEVHGWRNQYKADLVALVEDNLGGACGVAYVMTNVNTGFAPWAFSVTQDSCISGYTLAHELGHNMGSQHDRLEGGTGAYPYSFGHKEGGQFRTIMAYPCSPSCARINHFSNPNVLYQGSWRTGVDHNVDPANSADNARAFSNALNTIANFRNSGDTTAPPAPANLRIISP